MAKIEKRYERRKLVWAKGPARDVYRDSAVSNSRGGYFQISGEDRRYLQLFPKHLAGSFMGTLPWENKELLKPPPPFEQWDFVLITPIDKSGADVWLTHEISGDRIVEIVIPSM